MKNIVGIAIRWLTGLVGVASTLAAHGTSVAPLLTAEDFEVVCRATHVVIGFMGDLESLPDGPCEPEIPRTPVCWKVRGTVSVESVLRPKSWTAPQKIKVEFSFLKAFDLPPGGLARISSSSRQVFPLKKSDAADAFVSSYGAGYAPRLIDHLDKLAMTLASCPDR